MAWYEVDLSDGSKRKIWFGHDPTEDEVNQYIQNTPTIGAAPEGQAAGAAPEEPSGERGVTPLTRLLGTTADPNSPEVLLKGALFAGSGMFGEGGAPAAAKGASGVAQRIMQLVRKPPVAGAAVGAGAGYLEGGQKGAAIGALAGAGVPVVGGRGLRGIIGKYMNEAAMPIAAEEAAAAPAMSRAALNAARFKATQEAVAQQAAAKASMVDEVTAKILRLKNEHGLSGAQISAALHDLYGTTKAQGDELVQMVLQGVGAK